MEEAMILRSFPTTPPRTTALTKINVIASSIPLSTARIINLVVLSLGVSLNLLVIMVIFSKSSMRTTMNLYVVSFACSNMVILIEPLEDVLQWFFDTKLKLNMDYVCLISFDVSVITIAILKFQLYVNIFHRQTTFGQGLLRKTTAMKGIVLIWSACTISIAIGLHIYDFFEGDMAEIYVWNTFMFIAPPIVTFFALDALILYELMILREFEGSWRMNEIRQYVMLVIVALAFLLIRTPYRVARAVNFIEPKASCCTENKREVLYFIAKMFPAIFPIIYMALSCEFHGVVQETLRCGRRKSLKEIVDI
ncbi:green-sensitive opsin-like [Hylaeus volcanicus]|uniref:green-sensitive opsin-like n=1 Tax=Hylaeus volcanicus TaxID=313075 RepID=UPI0023B7FB7B|nr:green-sensitive opsin-like [Hylaeus volcanicus]